MSFEAFQQANLFDRHSTYEWKEWNFLIDNHAESAAMSLHHKNAENYEKATEYTKSMVFALT